MRLVLVIALAACTDTDGRMPEAPWTRLADLPERRLEAAAAASGSRLVVYGGFVTGASEQPRLAITNEVHVYDPFAETWANLPPPPVAWTHAHLVGVGGALYLLGGLEGETFVPRGRTFKLDLGAAPWLGEAWRELTPMPAGLERGAAAVVFTTGHIFLFGGDAQNGVTDSILQYEIANDAWTELPARLPTPRSHAVAMRDEDGTFVIAGGTGPQGPLGDAHALSPFGVWSLRAPMNQPHGGCAYGLVYGNLVCAGGETVVNGAVVPSRVVEVYDSTLDEWTVTAEMPADRGGASGAVVASRLYVVGGSESIALEPTATLYELDLLDTFER